MKSVRLSLNNILADKNIQYFGASELLRPLACVPGPPLEKELANIIPTLRFADMLREEFGPTRVLSAFRGWPYNEQVGGAEHSLHPMFNALDLRPAVGSPGVWAQFMDDVGQPEFGGLGMYHKENFIHIDTRLLMFGRTPTRWRGE